MRAKKKTIALSGTTLTYELRRHPRARRTSLTLYPDGKLAVTLTPTSLEMTADHFIRKNHEWILNSLQKIRSKNRVFLPKLNKKNALELSKRAKALVNERLQNYNQLYGFSYNRVSVKDNLKQWGSCSPAKNLSFNVRILFLPSDVADAVIVHELCHLQEMNHSTNFWKLVSKALPYYTKSEKELKRYVIT